MLAGESGESLREPWYSGRCKHDGYRVLIGWAIKEALHDQIALLDYFDAKYGTPDRTIAWGHSLGGMITAGLLERNPDRFDAALPMCGVVAGGVGVWNNGLDGEFVFKTLLAPTSALQLVHITDPNANLGLAEQILAAFGEGMLLRPALLTSTLATG